MSPAPVKISRRTAERLAYFLEDSAASGGGTWMNADAAELRAAMKRRPVKRFVKLARARKTAKKDYRLERWDAVRKLVNKRADGRCENCGSWFTDFNPPEPDHFFGKKNAPETVGTVWMIDILCHRQKTRNEPSAEYWLWRFIAHCERHPNAPWSRREIERAQKRLDRDSLADASEAAGKAARP